MNKSCLDMGLVFAHLLDQSGHYRDSVSPVVVMVILFSDRWLDNPVGPDALSQRVGCPVGLYRPLRRLDPWTGVTCLETISWFAGPGVPFVYIGQNVSSCLC
jgi:hypothetical protein